jgi:hypothetical protein
LKSGEGSVFAGASPLLIVRAAGRESIMRLLLAAATAIAMIPATASAASWYLYFQDADTSWYLDADSIQKNGAWTRVARYDRYTRASGRTGIKSVAVTLEIDCRRRLYRLARFEPFDAAGKSMGAVNNPESGEEHPSVPGSSSEAAMKFVCDNDRAGKQQVADPRQG